MAKKMSHRMEEYLEEKVYPGIHKKIKKMAKKKHEKKKHHSKASSSKKSHAKKISKKSKIEKVLHEFKEGMLHSASKKGPMVKSRKQAVAIALSEARKAGEKVKPKRKKK